jgi:hypothetical protein
MARFHGGGEMRLFILLAVLAVTVAVGPASAQPAAGSEVSPRQSVACRALEVHTDTTLGVTLVVFHQRDDDDRGRVGALLREHDGAAIEFQTGDGASHPATVMRLKSCFGRGLLLYRAGGASLVEKDEFLLREPTAGAH